MRDPEVGEPPRRLDHRVVVQERLSHAHVHRVIHGLEPPEVQRLVEDLRRRQVAPEAHRARRAERAGQRAAGLRREAERAAPVAVAHENRLDRVPVVRVEEHLHGPVARLALRDDLQRRERHRLGESGTQRLRERGHLVVRARAARGPLPDLPRSVARLAPVGERAAPGARDPCQDGSVSAVIDLRSDTVTQPTPGHATRDRRRRRRRRAEARGPDGLRAPGPGRGAARSGGCPVRPDRDDGEPDRAEAPQPSGRRPPRRGEPRTSSSTSTEARPPTPD